MENKLLPWCATCGAWRDTDEQKDPETGELICRRCQAERDAAEFRRVWVRRTFEALAPRREDFR